MYRKCDNYFWNKLIFPRIYSLNVEILKLWVILFDIYLRSSYTLKFSIIYYKVLRKLVQNEVECNFDRVLYSSVYFLFVLRSSNYDNSWKEHQRIKPQIKNNHNVFILNEQRPPEKAIRSFSELNTYLKLWWLDNFLDNLIQHIKTIF